jgi:hypothetical protein
VQHAWLKRSGIGFGARYYTRQPGYLLGTFSIAAYDPMDVGIFYRMEHLGWRVKRL